MTFTGLGKISCNDCAAEKEDLESHTQTHTPHHETQTHKTHACCCCSVNAASGKEEEGRSVCSQTQVKEGNEINVIVCISGPTGTARLDSRLLDNGRHASRYPLSSSPPSTPFPSSIYNASPLYLFAGLPPFSLPSALIPFSLFTWPLITLQLLVDSFLFLFSAEPNDERGCGALRRLPPIPLLLLPFSPIHQLVLLCSMFFSPDTAVVARVCIITMMMARVRDAMVRESARSTSCFLSLNVMPLLLTLALSSVSQTTTMFFGDEEDVRSSIHE